MIRDPRGGYNRKKVDENFFKTWSPQMAYVLGLIFADGTILDTRASSRTCFLQIANTDKFLLERVRSAMSSSHQIVKREPRYTTFRDNKTYFCGECFSLRIGNKVMYQHLLNRGLSPRKSLTMKFPYIPRDVRSFFLRGYFDGDGSLNVYLPNGRDSLRVRVIFTSGSYRFLYRLQEKLQKDLDLSTRKVRKADCAFQLVYEKKESLKLLSFIYRRLNSAPYMKKKYNLYRLIRGSKT